MVLGPAASALEKQDLRPHPNLKSLHLNKVTGGCVSTEELQGQWPGAAVSEHGYHQKHLGSF